MQFAQVKQAWEVDCAHTPALDSFELLDPSEIVNGVAAECWNLEAGNAPHLISLAFQVVLFDADGVALRSRLNILNMKVSAPRMDASLRAHEGNYV